MNDTEVILVDEQDVETGTMDKMEAHKKGVLHRAFSIFIFNGKGELILQQRAENKYHSPELWSNTCCSHPMPGEYTLDAADRRLMEEMGIECALTEAFTYTYKADVGNGLTEHEYDHVYIGYYDGAVEINEDEVIDYRYLSVADIQDLLKEQPETFTEWFKILFPLLSNYLKQRAAKRNQNS